MVIPKQALLLDQLLLSLLVIAAAAGTAHRTALPGCPAKCGNITIPYPFGIGPGCFREGFSVDCKEDTDHSKAFFNATSFETIDVSLSGEARVHKKVAWACYNKSDVIVSSILPPITFGGKTLFKLSNTRNKFTAIGCSTLAYIVGGNDYVSGCVSICANASDINDGECSGIGCCQTSIPMGLDYYNVKFAGFDHSSVWNYSPCSYAFLVDVDSYTFTASDLLMDKNSTVPVVLNWAIRDADTCEEARRHQNSYACRSKDSECYETSNGYGYLCNCSRGYHGNPYLPDGCQDTNECEQVDRHPCYGICSNLKGGYTCSCPPGMIGDPSVQDGCTPKPNRRQIEFQLLLKLLTGIFISIFFLVFLSFWIYLGYQKRKHIRVKQKFFEQNGGMILQQQISSHKGVAFKIFTNEELEKATCKFHTNQVIGYGGHSIVYKGFLDGDKKVAIKKSKTMSETKTKEFAKEMLILSQINHKNVVKLLGCCLEVEVPMLVYEFVSNGTLFQYIHNENRKSPIPLDTRLRIAVESAEALAYLHSSASPPILHGDVKPSNILLDDNYSAKVSDFGSSRLAPMDETQLATLVQGTCGYLDPEYLQTCMLTEKSDVYSFGVVLLELLTGKKAFHFIGLEEERSLASRFISAIKEDRLLEILDDPIKKEGPMELLQEVAEIARRCLSVKGDERPRMKEVAELLERLRKYKQL